MTARRLLVPLLPLALAVHAAAGVTVTGAGTTGNGYRAWDGKARLDFGSRGSWALTSEFAWSHDMGETETLSKQGTLGFEHNPDDNWSFRGSGTYWRDAISGLTYAGPSWGVTYLVTKPKLQGLPMRAFMKLNQRESGEPIFNDNERPPEELFGVSYDNDLFVYHCPQDSSPRRVKLRRQKGKVLVPAAPDSVNVASFHPTLTLEAPLLKQRLVPSVLVGHYFYSKSPGLIEERAGQPRFSAASGSLGALAGGFLKNEGEAALDVLLPLHSRLHASLAASQSATDQTWAVTQELSAKTTAADRVSLRAKWDRTLQAGDTTDLYTGELIFYF